MRGGSMSLHPGNKKSQKPASVDKNNGTNDKFYRKIAILMYTEMFNFRPQS